MPISEHEALASLKVLVSVMKADGAVDESEKKSLAAALASFEVPREITVEGLIDQDIDLDATLAEIVSDEAKAQVYRSAWFMAHADGRFTKEEEAVVDRVAAIANPSATERASLTQLFAASPKNRYETLLESLGRLFRRRS
jgi:uncharacterized tellurite resistance protein B-like protein